MKTFFAWIIEALFIYFWKKHLRIQAEKAQLDGHTEAVQKEFVIYRNIVTEALTTEDLEDEVIDEILAEAAVGLVKRLNRLRSQDNT